MIYSDPTNIQGLIQDAYYIGKINANFIGANDMQRIINKYYLQLQEIIRGIDENFYMVVATANTSAATNSYTYPDGTGTAPAYDKIKSIWCAFQPVNVNAPLPTEYTKCDAVDPSMVNDPSYTFSTDSPKALLFGTYFTLLPIIDGVVLPAVQNGLKIYYISEQSMLINPTDTPKIFPSFQDAIVQGALIDIAQRKGDHQLKTDSMQIFEKRKKDIAAYAANRLPVQIGLVEGMDDAGGWQYPWGQNSMS